MKISRLLHAPRELVFEMWTNPDHIKHWWGPDGFTNTIRRMDVTKGGTWEFVMHGPDGKDYENKSVYMDIKPPDHIRFSHVNGPRFEMDITFEAQGNKTVLTISMIFESAEQLQHVINSVGADEGLRQNMVKLDAYLQGLHAERGIILSRVLNAPPRLVWEAWTQPEHVVQWWGPTGFTTTIQEMNVKPGAVWRFIMHGPDGTDYPNRIVFNEVVPYELLRYSHGSGIDPDPHPFDVTVTFTELNGKTNLTMQSVFPSIEARDAVVEKFGALEGGKQTLSRLAEWLATYVKPITLS